MEVLAAALREKYHMHDAYYDWTKDTIVLRVKPAPAPTIPPAQITAASVAGSIAPTHNTISLDNVIVGGGKADANPVMSHCISQAAVAM